jgi:hypothetical protein
MNVIDDEDTCATPQITESVGTILYEQFLEEMYESERKLEFTNQFIKIIKEFTSYYFLPIADRIDQFCLKHSNK